MFGFEIELGLLDGADQVDCKAAAFPFAVGDAGRGLLGQAVVPRAKPRAIKAITATICKRFMNPSEDASH